MNYLINGSDRLPTDFKLIGRENELERLSSILMRSKANSIILVGAGGVGCSVLCMGLQAMKDDPNAPFDIISKRLFWLDVDGLFSSGKSEEINAQFQKICSILKRTPDSVMIVEDTRDFIEAMRNYGQTHFINSINSMVKSHQTQIIFEVRDEDLDMVLKVHSDMNEYYTMIDLAEPAPEVLPEIIKGISSNLVEHHGIKIQEDAYLTALEITSKYRTRDLGLSRAQPERTITLLDRALSTFRLNAHKQHPKVTKLLELQKADPSVDYQPEIDRLNKEFSETQSKIKELFVYQRDGEAAIISLDEQIEEQLETERKNREAGVNEEVKKFNSMASVGGFDSEIIRELKKKKSEFQKLVTENKKEFDALTDIINNDLILSKNNVLSEFSAISGISANKLNEDERAKLKHLESDILKRIFGQDIAVRKLADAIKVAKIGRRQKGRPMASFMYLGPSGVGKTEIAKALAASILDDEAALLRFDMSEYMSKHDVAKLIGAPPGYEGFEAGGILTNAMRRNPNRILLFDEIEKAHPDIFNIFLQILSDGRLTDNVGRVVSFESAIIIMTTNIGQPHFLNEDLSWDDMVELANKDLAETYRSEFLNRFAGRENIICFKKLELDSIEKIVRKEIESIDKTYSDQGLGVKFNEKDMKTFCKDFYDPKIGARGLPGYIQSNLESMITNTILDNPSFVGNFIVKYDSKNRKFDYELEEAVEKAA